MKKYGTQELRKMGSKNRIDEPRLQEPVGYGINFEANQRTITEKELPVLRSPFLIHALLIHFLPEFLSSTFIQQFSMLFMVKNRAASPNIMI